MSYETLGIALLSSSSTQLCKGSQKELSGSQARTGATGPRREPSVTKTNECINEKRRTNEYHNRGTGDAARAIDERTVQEETLEAGRRDEGKRAQVGTQPRFEPPAFFMHVVNDTH